MGSTGPGGGSISVPDKIASGKVKAVTQSQLTLSNNGHDSVYAITKDTDVRKKGATAATKAAGGSHHDCHVRSTGRHRERQLPRDRGHATASEVRVAPQIPVTAAAGHIAARARRSIVIGGGAAAAMRAAKARCESVKPSGVCGPDGTWPSSSRAGRARADRDGGAPLPCAGASAHRRLSSSRRQTTPRQEVSTRAVVDAHVLAFPVYMSANHGVPPDRRADASAGAHLQIVSVADIFNRGVSLDWYESVAIVSGLCSALGEQSATAMPPLEHIHLTPAGTISLAASGIRPTTRCCGCCTTA